MKKGRGRGKGVNVAAIFLSRQHSNNLSDIGTNSAHGEKQ